MKKERKELRETNQEIKRERVRGKQHTLNGCSNSKTWQLNCRDKINMVIQIIKLCVLGAIRWRETGICVNRDHMRQ